MRYKPVTWQVNGTIFTAKTTYVDIETGEIIKKKTAKDKTKYIIIKTTKNVKHNQSKSRATVEYTTECRRNPQRKLFD